MYTSGEKGNTAIEETLDYQKGEVELWRTDEHCGFRWSVETKREKGREAISGVEGLAASLFVRLVGGGICQPPGCLAAGSAFSSI